jgi:hypothetical protein
MQQQQSEWAKLAGVMGAAAARDAMMCSTATINGNVGWQYERPDFVPSPPRGIAVRPLEPPPEPEEPPEVEPLASDGSEYEPLKLETHNSFSARLSRRKD